MSPLAYVPPGVTIQELTSPSITPTLAIPGSVCLVGMSSGTITRTDTVKLTSATVVTLPGVPRNATMTSSSIVSVIDAVNPSVAPGGFVSGVDYTFTPSTHTIVRIVASRTLTGGGAAAGAASFTLTAGSVPLPGQVVRLTDGSLTEIATVLSVSGQTVTLESDLINSYTGGSAVTWGTIPDSDSVYVTYTYTPIDYYEPVRLNSMGDIQTRFGQAWDATTTSINSILSFAASLAFENGASNVVLQPLYHVNSSSGVKEQPDDTTAASATTWATVFNRLLSLDDINILVPVVGQSATNVNDAVQLQILSAAQDYIYQAKHNNGSYQITVLGEDSTASLSEGQDATLVGHAQTLASRYGNDVTQQVVLVNTSEFSKANATSSFLIGGQYAAAAIAGMLAARNPAATLTRQLVSGVLSVTDPRTIAQKNNDAANGMLVVESVGNVVQVRHGITLDTTSVATRELNVVRAKHYIIESVALTLNTQVIGKIVADADAPTLVNNVVIGTLEDLRLLGDLNAYSGVQSRILSIDPTAMEVRFSYQPAFTVNYVAIVFSLDLTNQSLSVNSSVTG